MSRTVRMMPIGALAIAVLAFVGGGSAHAVPPPPGDVNPAECLNQWENNPNYVGEGWVAARVRVVRDVLERDIFLGCGDERSGIIHIAHPDTTGTLHPIPPGEEDFFLRCLERTLRSSTIGRTRDGRREYTFDWLKSNPGNSEVPQQVMRTTAYVDENANFVYTLFTSEDGGASGPQNPPRTNFWAECAVSPLV